MYISTFDLGAYMVIWFIAGSIFGYIVHKAKPQHPDIEEQMRKKFAHSQITDVLDKPLYPEVKYDLDNPTDQQVLEVKDILGI